MAGWCIRVRGTAVLLGSTGLLARAVSLLDGGLQAPTGDPSAGLTRICTVALLAALVWGWATVVAGVLEAWRHAGVGVPVLTATVRAGQLRRLVLAACGVALSGAVVTPVAHAAPTADAPTVAVPAAAPQVVQREVRQHGIVVRRGDCLWSLAAAEVQPGAGPATVTARWRAVYAANRDVIGDDPDLIRPGQHLRLPR